jgi:hypothetical protein
LAIRVDSIVEVDVYACGTSGSNLQRMESIRQVSLRENQSIILEEIGWWSGYMPCEEYWRLVINCEVGAGERCDAVFLVVCKDEKHINRSPC